MRAVVQRVRKARASVDGAVVGSIEGGLCVLLGVAAEDGPEDADYLARKLADLRIFSDETGKFNLSVKEMRGSILIVSQFTLHADCKKGRRPSFAAAAPLQKAKELYEAFVHNLQGQGVPTATGWFQAHMEVALINDGPVTILLDSRDR